MRSQKKLQCCWLLILFIIIEQIIISGESSSADNEVEEVAAEVSITGAVNSLEGVDGVGATRKATATLANGKIITSLDRDGKDNNDPWKRTAGGTNSNSVTYTNIQKIDDMARSYTVTISGSGKKERSGGGKPTGKPQKEFRWEGSADYEIEKVTHWEICARVDPEYPPIFSPELEAFQTQNSAVAGNGQIATIYSSEQKIEVKKISLDELTAGAKIGAKNVITSSHSIGVAIGVIVYEVFSITIPYEYKRQEETTWEITQSAPTDKRFVYKILIVQVCFTNTIHKSYWQLVHKNSQEPIFSNAGEYKYSDTPDDGEWIRFNRGDNDKKAGDPEYTSGKGFYIYQKTANHTENKCEHCHKYFVNDIPKEPQNIVP